MRIACAGNAGMWIHNTFWTAVALIIVGVLAMECFWIWQELHTPADLLPSASP